MTDLLSCFFDFSDEYLLILENKKIIKANTSFLTSLGYEEQQVVGENITDLVLPMDKEAFEKSFNEGSDVTAQVLSKKKKAVRVNWSFQKHGNNVLIKGVDLTEILRQKDRFQQYSLLLRGVNESLERSSHRLYLLQSALTSTIPYAESAISKILEITLQTFGFNTAIVTRRKKGFNYISDIVGNIPEQFNKRVSDPNSFSIKVFESGKELMDNISHDKITDQEEYIKGGNYFIGFPLKFEQSAFGTIEFLFDKEGATFAFDNSDLQFLKLIADVVGRVVELQRINSDLEDKTAKLLVKNQELDDFAHIVSHDLKAPLRGITNLIAFVKDDLSELTLPEQSKVDMDMITQRAGRMAEMIDGILRYSKVGREAIEPSVFSLKDMVGEVVSQLQEMNKAANIEVKGDFPEVFAKELFLYQILSNLLSNSIKYNDKDKPEILIQGTEIGDNLEIRVEDNGPGIPEEHREKVFGVFETLNSKDEVESTGIGLTIVKKMIDLLKGTVEVEDSSLGGVSFVIIFPKTSK